MKPWFKRSLFGFAGAALVAGSLVGCGHRHGWGGGSEQDRAEFRARMVERVGSKLELDATQKQKTAYAHGADREAAGPARGAARRRRSARRVPRPVRRRQTRPGARREARAGQDCRHPGRQPRSDRGGGRLLRQPEPGAAAEGARVHGARRPPLGTRMTSPSLRALRVATPTPSPGATPAARQSRFRGVSPTGLAAPAGSNQRIFHFGARCSEMELRAPR